MAFLEIDRLYKRFGTVEVLKDISISVDEGGFLVLVGPSGCGKSTLLNTIAGLEEISEGAIRINGQVVNDLHPSMRDIAMVFQSYALYPNMNVAQNIAFGLEMRGVSKADRDRAVQDVAEMLQIGHLLSRRPGQLSGGQRQRVAMGRALVRQPQVFLFDEPLSNLDAKLRVDMRVEIKRLHQNLGTTIVYVTHDQIEAMTLATQIAVLKDGVLQQLGSPAEIYSKPANLFVADFMGAPTMNLLPAEIITDDSQLKVQLMRKDGPVRLPLPQSQSQSQSQSQKEAQSQSGLREGQRITFGLRPEDIRNKAAADDEAEAADWHRLPCAIDVVEPTGADIYVVTEFEAAEVTARLDASAAIRAGDQVDLHFNMAKAHFFDPDSGLRI